MASTLETLTGETTTVLDSTTSAEFTSTETVPTVTETFESFDNSSFEQTVIPSKTNETNVLTESLSTESPSSTLSFTTDESSTVFHQPDVTSISYDNDSTTIVTPVSVENSSSPFKMEFRHPDKPVWDHSQIPAGVFRFTFQLLSVFDRFHFLFSIDDSSFHRSWDAFFESISKHLFQFVMSETIMNSIPKVTLEQFNEEWENTTRTVYNVHDDDGVFLATINVIFDKFPTITGSIISALNDVRYSFMKLSV